MVEREPSVSEEDLHAYVDGQVAGGDCAAIEKWLESHPEDAARVAAWHAQADAIRARYGAVAIDGGRGSPLPLRCSHLSLVARRAGLAATFGKGRVRHAW
jgi:hypothetical protein